MQAAPDYQVSHHQQKRAKAKAAIPNARQTWSYGWILGVESDTSEKITFLHFCLNSWQKPRKKPNIPQLPGDSSSLRLELH